MDRLPFDPYDFFGYLASGLLFVVGSERVLGLPHVLGQKLEVVDGAVLLLATYVAGQVIATLAKSVFEEGLVEKVLGSPSENLFRDRTPRVRGVLFREFYKPLPSSAREKVLKKARDEGVAELGEALFLCARFSRETLTDERLMKRLDTFINQYGFSRNLAFTSLVVGFALLMKSNLIADVELLTYGLAALLAGVVLFYRYLKFYRQYSYELFNVYASH